MWATTKAVIAVAAVYFTVGVAVTAGMWAGEKITETIERRLEA